MSPTSIAAAASAMGRPAAEQPSPKFMRRPLFDAMNANLADTNVQSTDHENIGTIKGIAIGEGGSLFYVLTVTGNRDDVAVSPAARSLSYDDTAGKWNTAVDATKEQIDSAPEGWYNKNYKLS
jgi:hypothetical protein